MEKVGTREHLKRSVQTRAHIVCATLVTHHLPSQTPHRLGKQSAGNCSAALCKKVLIGKHGVYIHVTYIDAYCNAIIQDSTRLSPWPTSSARLLRHPQKMLQTAKIDIWRILQYSSAEK